MSERDGGGLNVAVISSSYPSADDQVRVAATFVKAFVNRLRDHCRVQVVAPRAIGRDGIRAFSQSVGSALEKDVSRPRYMPMSARHLPFGYSTFRWTNANFTRAVNRVGANLSPVPNLVYGHWLFPSGWAAAELGARFGVPAVAAMGEGSPENTERLMGLKRVRILAQRLSGIMCTSDYNMRFCTEILEVPAERLRLFPNAADDANFHPRDRAAVRRELGLPPETFIVLFSGHFDENKGAHRLLRALEAVPTARAIFLGDGPALPSNSRILHQGRVPHSEMPKWLSAADLFALPVLVEASSNAVAEAMACGLPIVTSDIPSMRLMVGFDAGKLIDPRDVNAIGDALRIFFEDPDLRARMAAAALQKARSYTLADRTAKIVGWFEDLTA